MSNVKDRIKLFEKKGSLKNKTAWDTNENNNNIEGSPSMSKNNVFEKHNPKKYVSPKRAYGSKFSSPPSKTIPVVADEEIDYSSKLEENKDIFAVKKIGSGEAKDSPYSSNYNDNSNKDNNFTKDAKNLNNNSKNNGDKKENLKEPQGNKTDFSFKSNRDTTKQAFSSVKLPDHLEKIKSKQRALKKSAKKAKKKKERRSEKMELLHKKLGKQLKFQQDLNANFDQEDQALRLDIDTSSPERINAPKSAMTPSMKDFMKRLEKKDVTKSKDNEDEINDGLSKENSPPNEDKGETSVIHTKKNNLEEEKNKTEQGEKNSIENTRVNKSEGERNILTAPSLLVYEVDDIDNVKINGTTSKIDAKNSDLNSVPNMTLFINDTDIGEQSNLNEKEYVLESSSPKNNISKLNLQKNIETSSHAIKELQNNKYKHNEKHLEVTTKHNTSNIIGNSVTKNKNNGDAEYDNNSHLYEEIKRLRSELENAKSARSGDIHNHTSSNINTDQTNNNNVNQTEINEINNRPKTAREKIEDTKKTARKILRVAHAVGKRKSVKWAYYNRFCLPSCGKLQRNDSKAEIFARIIAQLWLHSICAFFLLFIAIIAVTTYSWAPQFYRAPTGMSLLVMVFFKTITSTIVVASIYRNVDSTACMLPFYSCWHTKYEPMIIYEKAWLRGITYTKLFDFAVGMWTWAAYFEANNIVGRPRTPTLDFLMTWLFLILFFIDIWSLLLVFDLGMIIKSWLTEMPDNHVRDGYTLHGFMEDSDDDSNTDDDSSEYNSDDGGELFVDENNKTRKNISNNFNNGTPLKQNSSRAAKETPRTPLSKQDSARLWGAKTERGVDRPVFVPKLELGAGKSSKSKKRVSHLSGLPTFPKIAEPKIESNLDSIAENISIKNAPEASNNLNQEHYNQQHDTIHENEKYHTGKNEERTQNDEWEAHADHEGNQYFISKYTGESVWEIPKSNLEEHTIDMTAETGINHIEEDYEKHYLSINNEIIPYNFEQLWTKMKINSTVMMELHNVPAPKMVIEDVSSKGFYVVASGVKGSKFTVYLYGKNYNEDVNFLSEISFDSITRHMTAVIKCDHKPKLNFFLGILRVKDLCSL
jgi:hypothetical protein